MNRENHSKGVEVYVLFYKPKGVITTTSWFERPNILDFVRLRTKFGFVGRLDKDAEGLLFLTNDGYIIEKLTHPRYKVEKVYEVKLNKPFSKSDFERVKSLRINNSYVYARVHSINKSRTRLKITIKSGEKHIVKRIFKKMGYHVNSLKRVRIGVLSLGKLRPGEYRFLSKKEIVSLKDYVSKL